MALNELKSFIAQQGKSSNKIISGMALAILLSFAAQDVQAQGGVGINIPNPQAALHIGIHPNGGGFLISAQDTATFPNPVAGVINQHTDGNYYKYNSTQRVPFNGTNGTSGVDGVTWLTASGVPNNTNGVDNDLYLNTANGEYYKKIAGIWTSQGNLTGGQGFSGTDGTDGTNGTNGATGQTGPTGSGVPTGTANGQTIRYDGTNWVANTNVYNDGNKAGVGTTAPITKMDIRIISADTLDIFQVRKQTTPALYIKNNLNVGFGLVDPKQKFDLRSGKFRFSTTGAPYADLAFDEPTRTRSLAIKPGSGVERTLINIDGSNNRMSVGFNPSLVDATLFVDADVNPDDNGIIVKHNQGTDPSGGEGAVPGIKVIGNGAVDTKYVGVQVESGDIYITDPNRGYIMKNTGTGSPCYRLKVVNGALLLEVLTTCPN